MTNEERQQAIEWLKRRPVMMAGAKRMYDLAVEALEAYVPDTNVGDMISRQTATTIPVMPKEHRHYQTNNLDDAYEQGWNDLQECIGNLPPVQPKRGKWLPDNRCGGGYWVCSSCKHPTEAFAADVIYKYCPFCGADMRCSENPNS